MMTGARQTKASFPFAGVLSELAISFVCFGPNVMDKQRNRKEEGDNRSNMRSHGYTLTRMRMFGMWLLCQVELRGVDTSSESLGKKTGDRTM